MSDLARILLGWGAACPVPLPECAKNDKVIAPGMVMQQAVLPIKIHVAPKRKYAHRSLLFGNTDCIRILHGVMESFNLIW